VTVAQEASLGPGLRIEVGAVTGRESLRWVLAAECGHLRATDVAAVVATVGVRCTRLTVTAVAEPLHRLAIWAPLTGLETPERMQRRAVESASVAARDAVAHVPLGIPAEHRAAACWRDVAGWLLSGSYDVLVLAGSPTRRCDRRLLSRLASSRRAQRDLERAGPAG
jgi:hypothetical protein